MRIREAVLQDAEVLAEIEAVCFPPEEAAGRSSIESRLSVFPECFLILELDGRAVGFINGMTTSRTAIVDCMFDDASLHDPEGAWQSVFGLDVLPEYRCQGCAAALMKEFIDRARKRGKRGCILTCKEHLIHYYEKFGYVNQGISQSVHGGAVWYDMQLEF